MTAYWGQFTADELDSMQGTDDVDDDFCDEDCEIEELIKSEKDECPKCSGWGCNYCLML